MKFFELARDVKFETARLTAFGSTRKPNIAPNEDPNLAALLQSRTPVVTIFGKTWDLHVEQVMANTLEENLAMIEESVRYLVESDREVIYDAEHFFDGWFDNESYALKTLLAAAKAGATHLVLCDTNGGTLPHDIESVTAIVKEKLDAALDGAIEQGRIGIGIHTHNDSALAVANSIAAVRSGATMVQGTINGYGERCGNADLTAIIPILAVKMKRECIAEGNLAKLRSASRFISEKANVTPLKSRPFVGESAFAHKGGIHVSAVMKDPRAYEHMEPELVGNSRRVLMSDLSGKSNVEYRASELGIDLSAEGASRTIVSEIKRMEQEGYQFDAADGSFEIFMEKATDKFVPFFKLKSFRIGTERDENDTCHSYATIKIEVGGKEEITAAEGSGPVSALDNALRKALEKFYENNLDSMHLVDYKVRVLDGRDGTSAKVRVLIDSRDESQVWSTIGVSEDIIEASWQALADSFQYKLAQCKANGKLETDYREMSETKGEAS